MRLLLCVICIFPLTAFGWGETGHKTVCQIAYEELTGPARTEVDRLIDLDPDYAAFADSCLFADGPPRIRTEDHYLNVPRSSLSITTGECLMADTCLFPAIRNDTAILADTNNSDGDRLDALKLLGHWVGDMHQPMHVSYQDDRGANSINQKDREEWRNLHGAWDYDIIEQRVGTDFAQVTQALRAQISDDDRSRWMHDSPVEWANESYQITISPTTEYCVLQQGACWYSIDNMMLSGDEPHREIEISDDYMTAQSGIIERRLKQAGIRLGALLNASLQ